MDDNVKGTTIFSSLDIVDKTILSSLDRMDKRNHHCRIKWQHRVE